MLPTGNRVPTGKTNKTEQDIDGGAACVTGAEGCGNSASSVQLCCEPKTALKKVYY